MDLSVVDEFKLYKKEWCSEIDASVLESTAAAVLQCHLKLLAPSLFSTDACNAVDQTTKYWRSLVDPHATYKSIASPNLAGPGSDEEDTRYWSTYRFLTRLRLQQSTRDQHHPYQFLFPASIAKYVQAKGPTHARFV